MPDLAPDTQQNLMYAIYFTITHNFEAIVYLGFMGLAFIIALIKPTRAMILIMLGFGLLLFGFQYNKHILEPLRMQTQSALITERQSFRTQRAIDLTLARVLPRAFPLAGWSSIAFGLLIGIAFEWRPKREEKHVDHSHNRGRK
jgi:L-asparagine transporter-like permease